MVTPIVYAHRGASRAAPENTVEAFALAGSLGADGVELDVRRCADLDLVLHHDAALPDGRVVWTTRRVGLPASVPTLTEALDVCAGLVVNIEIKNLPHEPDFDADCAVVDSVVELLSAREGRDDVLVSSFHLATIDRVHSLDPAIPTGLLTFVDPAPTDGVALARDRGHHAIHPHEATVDAALVDVAHAAGLAVNVWTVDDPDRMRALADLGVDGIVTNVPDVARDALGPSSR